MNTRQKLRQAKLAHWASCFQDQAASGLTAKSWCNQNNISIHAYNYWKRLCKEEYIDSLLPDIVPVSFPVDSAPSQVPTEPDNTMRDSRESCNTGNTLPSLDDVPICITLNDLRIEVGASVSTETLVSIIKAVRYA